jgi:hypothetical protein
MTCRRLCRTVVAGASVAIFSLRPAFAQEPDLDPAMMCDAAAAAYQAYALNSTDPDLEAANARVTEGVTDCKNGQNEQGLWKVNEGTAMIHDHVRTKMR